MSCVRVQNLKKLRDLPCRQRRCYFPTLPQLGAAARPRVHKERADDDGHDLGMARRGPRARWDHGRRRRGLRRRVTDWLSCLLFWVPQHPRVGAAVLVGRDEGVAEGPEGGEFVLRGQAAEYDGIEESIS